MKRLQKEDQSNLLESLSNNKNMLRNRKRTTDSKQLLPLLNCFKILAPLKQKPLSAIKAFSRDISKYIFRPGQQIKTNTITHPLEQTWFILQGKVIIDQINQEICRQLSEGDCFSSHICSFRQYLNQPDNYIQFSITAKTNCILLSIHNSKISKLYQIDEVQEQLQKRTLICQALNLHIVGVTIKSFVKKFVFRKLNKSTIVIKENQKQQYLFIVVKGDLELTKSCENRLGQKIKLRIGIVTQNSFINDFSFFKQSQIGLSKYTVEAITQTEVYFLPKSELFKYFYDLPTLWPSISSICQQKQKSRQMFIQKYIQKRHEVKQEQSIPQFAIPLTKNSLFKQNQAINKDFFTQSSKFQYLISSKQRVVRPLMSRKLSSTINKNQFQPNQIKKIIKKQKMDIMKVKNLVDNRIRGIKSDQIIIKLKPTLFNDRAYTQDIEELKLAAIYTPSGCLSSRSRIKKNMSVRESIENLRHTQYRANRSITAKLNNKKIKRFRMINPPREHFQSTINKSSDPYIFTHCQTGKTRKVRAIY